MLDLLLNPWILLVIKMLVAVGIVLSAVPMLVWMERKVSARFQRRLGPNRVGPFGLFQSIADAVKLLFKEDIFPKSTDKFIFLAAPIMAFIPGVLSFALIPIGRATGFEALGPNGVLAVSYLQMGVLLFMAVSSLSSYGLSFAGWASNNQYSLLGGVRSSAQLISYEVVMGLSVLSLLMMTGTLNFSDIVLQQESGLWYAFRQPVTFLLFFVAAFAETNRAPFDLPEAEQELVGGYHTEYTGMRYAWFMLGEYAALWTMCSILTTLFLGGWTLPFVSKLLTTMPWYVEAAGGFAIFLAKVVSLVFFFMWVRWTMPRFRWDQLMRLGWNTLIPIGLVNIVVTALLIQFIGGALYGR
jgi:NADH-quinone oxidoreductase subunit H